MLRGGRGRRPAGRTRVKNSPAKGVPVTFGPMPPLTRWFVRSALFWFVLALGHGSSARRRGISAGSGHRLVLPYPTYLHLLTVGWLTI